jgi:hypothetical protein
MCVEWGVGGVGVDSWWGLSCRTMAFTWKCDESKAKQSIRQAQ